MSRRLLGHHRHRGGARPRPDGQIVTVFAAKGGCGKTTLATNLAVALAAGTGCRVCVVDLDLAFGDVAISVQLDPARTIVDALPMAGHLDVTGAASLLTRYRPGLEMLLAPVTPGDAEKIPPALVGELLTVLRGDVRLRRGGHPGAVQRARADRDGRLGAPRAAHHARRARR